MKKILLLLMSIFIIALANTAFAEEDYAIRLHAINLIISNSKLYSELTTDTDTSVLTAFDDYTKMSTLPNGSLKTLAISVNKRVINGYEDNTLRPLAPLTRAEYAVMLYRARDYFDELDTYGEYINSYPDVSDWNRDAIAYCIEHGLMMGYGTTFGADDLLTNEQVNLIGNRMMYGLSTLEKYTVLSINGASPINVDKIKASSKELIPDDTEINISEDSYRFTAMFKDYIDARYNFDYRKFDQKNAYEKLNKYAKRAASFSTGPTQEKTVEFEIDLFAENFKSNYIAEAFLITTPELYDRIGGIEDTGSTVMPYHYDTAVGYLYFKIDANPEQAKKNNLPVGSNNQTDNQYDIILGKWYRQKIKVIRHNNRGIIHYEFTYFETIEPLPAEFYN